jgi:hypothetical protein
MESNKPQNRTGNMDRPDAAKEDVWTSAVFSALPNSQLNLTGAAPAS